MPVNSVQTPDGTIIRRETIDLDAGTYTLEVDGAEVESRPLTPEEVIQYSPPPPTPEELEAQALRVAARVAVVDKVRAEDLTDAEVASIAPIFPPWEPDIAVTVGEVYQWDGTLVEVIQGHVTQADWEPDQVPALFKIHRTDSGGGPIQWQPGIAVEVDEIVTYEGTSYRVIQAHTTQAGWTPPAVPSLFEPLP